MLNKKKFGEILITNLSYNQKQYITNLLDLSKVRNKLILSAVKDNIKIKKQFTENIENITSILKYGFKEDKIKGKGITFTPIKLINYMYKGVLDYDLKKLEGIKIADLSSGNGAFFVGLILYIKEKDYDFNIKSFIENNIFGFDVEPENIQYTKLILSIVCEYFGEDSSNMKFNLYVVDTLREYSNNKIRQKFDLIVGNPPYVKQQNIDLNYRNFLENNYETVRSNYNLYYAFIEITTNLLNKNGKAMLLVPNYILKIKSAEKLRQYLIKGKFLYKIVDFGHQKLFDGIDTYSMILELSSNSSNLMYKNIFEINDLVKINEIDWKYKSLSKYDYETINLTSNDEDEFIYTIQNQVNKLDISTGIATQKDNLYLIDDVISNDNNKRFFKNYNNKKYEIESNMVSKIIKGSGSSKKGKVKEQFIIFPYLINDKNANLISKNILSKKYPKTFKYFSDIKEQLLKRSGIKNDDIDEWYKFGRSQSLNRTMPKIVFPTNSDKPNFKFYKEKALFYNGYAVYGLENKDTDTIDMKCITIILNSKLIDKFMHLTSYYIGGGYISYQKKYLSKVTIPNMTKEEKVELVRLNKKNSDSLDDYISKLYFN